MECVWRCRRAVLVRSLLMDASVTEDEMNAVTEQTSEDGVLLPVVKGHGADLTPAAEDQNTSPSSSSPRPCALCLSQPARYTCPRCNAPYCSLPCYRGPSHTACSEQFYKECVSQELRRRRGGTEREDRIRVRDVLLRMRREEGGPDGASERDTETLTLLSRLAEMEKDGVEGHEDEVRDVLQRLAQRDGEEDEEDLAARMSGLGVESLTEDDLWTLLPEKDKREFKRLLRDGGIGALVPPWCPWWEEHERDAPVLIEEVQREEGDNSSSETPIQQEVKKTEGRGNNPPPISSEIPPLSSLCSASPSPLVKFAVVNALYGYAFALRLFNGDVSETDTLQEFTRLLLSVSECLGRGRTFASFPEALGAAMARVQALRYDSDSALSSVEGVAHILSGANGAEGAGFTLSALSHLRSVFGEARAAAPRGHAHFRKSCFLAGKKCEFLQAWVNENTHTLRGLAAGAWSQCHTHTGERREMDRDRKRVEEKRRTRNAPGNVMIKEI